MLYVLYKYIPEITYDNENIMDLANTTKIIKRRFLLKCCFCGKKNGACTKCNFKRCQRYFHITCAQKENALDEVLNGECIEFIGFCQLHKIENECNPEQSVFIGK